MPISVFLLLSVAYIMNYAFFIVLFPLFKRSSSKELIQEFKESSEGPTQLSDEVLSKLLLSVQFMMFLKIIFLPIVLSIIAIWFPILSLAILFFSSMHLAMFKNASTEMYFHSILINLPTLILFVNHINGW